MKPTANTTWDKMTNDEKLDSLTSVLTRAGSDIEFRNRCLRSNQSALEAVSEAGGIEFPADFEIEFLTPEQRVKKLVLAVPELIAREKGEAEIRQAEDYQTCSYIIWRS